MLSLDGGGREDSPQLEFFVHKKSPQNGELKNSTEGRFWRT